MAEESKPAELALINAARTLDQGGVETIPDKLDQILKILEVYPGGRFHAAEEVIVRWLLKNMNGPSGDAERLRRYPLTWRILTTLFSTIPLFSLAKSLADRRFVVVLQTTVKDLSEAKQHGSTQDGESSDTDMTDAYPDETQPRPSKRKKVDPISFDLRKQRLLPGCLRAAEGLFKSLHALLARLELKGNARSHDDPMGAEHIKSLFSSHANGLKDILAPALAICQLAVDNSESTPSIEQDTWISTISNILDLHIKNDGDVVEVATYLSRTSLNMLGRLTGTLDDRQLGIPLEVKIKWTRDLRLFLTRNLILPARAAFVNRRTTEAMEMAVKLSSSSDTVCYPVIFDLVLSSPHIVGSQSTKRENDAWTQAVFDILEESLRASSSEERPAAILSMMHLVHKRGIALSLQSLRSVCRCYALQPDQTNWALLSRIAEINCDVFVTGERQELIYEVLERTRGDSSLSDEESEVASSFIVSLAAGFGRARDLAGFIMKWFQYLALAKPHLESRTNWFEPWCNDKLIETVAESLQRSMNAKQILSLLDWLDPLDTLAENAALMFILFAISGGHKSIAQDELTDVVGMRIFNMAFNRCHLVSLPEDVAVRRWALIERSIAWATLEQAQSIWTQISPELHDILETRPLADESTVFAFRCSVATWLANYPGGKHEDDAAQTACKFLIRVTIEANTHTEEEDPALTSYMSDIMASRWLSLALETNRVKDACTDVAFSKLTDQLPVRGDHDRMLSVWANKTTSDFLINENNINSRSTLDTFLVCLVGINGGHGKWSSPTMRKAVGYLLAMPIEAIPRERRESIMKDLIRRGPGSKSDVSIDISDMNRTISLMVKLMRRPTFYPKMKFSDLDGLATQLQRFADLSGPHMVAIMSSSVQLLQELATLTLRQMTSNIETRERDYLLEAVSQSRGWHITDAPYSGLARVVLLKPLISALQQPSVLKAVPDVDLQSHRLMVANQVSRAVEYFCDSSSTLSEPSCESHVAPLLVALSIADIMDQDAISTGILPKLPRLLGACELLRSAGHDSHWDLKNALAKLFGKEIQALGATEAGPATTEQESAMPDLDLDRIGFSERSFNKAKILEFVDTTIQNMDEVAKLEYLRTLLAKADDLPDKTCQLLSAYRVVQRLEGTRTAPDVVGDFDLSVAHSSLCKKLRASDTAVEFVLVAQTLHAILEKPSCTTQWNIELTLSTVSTLSSNATTHPVISTCPKAFKWLCRLVQVVLRRHRLRLEGHFHLVVTTLQPLLRTLVSHPYDSAGKAVTSSEPITDAAQYPHWESHARLFSRLLTLVCEPSAASVSRSQTGSLDSATDAARRSTGQHMYLVLMLYVRLQLEQGVPRAVREAVEPGVFSVLDITTPEVRRIMNDAMDASGRAVLRELYKQYLKFGKWSGV